VAGLIGCAVGGAVHDTSYAPGLKGGIAEATLVGFDNQIIDVFQTHHTQGSAFNPFHRAIMERLRGGGEQVITCTNRDIVAPGEWDRSTWINEYVRPARVDHFIGSVRMIGKSSVAGCGFMRSAGDKPFSDEDRELLDLVHLGAGRFFESASPRTLLPPRAQDTLDVMLTGATDKEIAAQLRISPHTVRQYVKVILRTYGVSSRGQLIAQAGGKRG
jgi:DNA-binding CsgD family transcriptional regulator